jgi:hypothetical protein
MKILIPLAAWLLTAALAGAQEPTFMGAATHPGQGQVYGRALFAVEDGENYEIHARAVYGIVSRLALQLDAHHEWLADESDDSSGTVQLKYRVLQNDFSPLNTWRASVVGGVEFISDGDPAVHVGIVTTSIINRHGLNGQIDWAGYASDPDETMLNISHLYRIAPAQYRADTKGAWYTQLESLNTLYDDGDYEMDLAPGLLYEARKWAAEVSLRLPVAGNYVDQPDYTLATGVRYLF